MKITSSTVKTAFTTRAAALAANPAVAYRDTLRDSSLPGLALVINRSSASWIFSYRPAGLERVETAPGIFTTKRPGTRHVKLGSIDAMSPDEARAGAAKLKLAVTAKQDPAADRRAHQKAREATTQRATCNALLPLYEVHLGTVTSRKTRRPLGERYIATEIANLKAVFSAVKIGDLAPDQITTDHINDITTIAKGPVAARHQHGGLVRFLAWCLTQKRITANIARDVPLPPAPPSRSRWLTSEEIKAVWEGADKLDSTFRDFVRWLLAIPCRRDEAASLRWPAIDITNAVWTQAAADTKNHEDHRFSIHPIAMGIITARLDSARQPGESRDAALKRLKAEDALVFASPRTSTPITAFSRTLDRLHKASGTSGWSFHDCRRTFASHMGEGGADLGIIDQILNHRASASRGGIIGVYQKSSRWPAQQAAMAVWGRMLGTFIGKPEAASGNVITLNSNKGA